MPSASEHVTLLQLCLTLGRLRPWGKLSRREDFVGQWEGRAFGGGCAHMGEGGQKRRGISHIVGRELTLQIFILSPQCL